MRYHVYILFNWNGIPRYVGCGENKRWLLSGREHKSNGKSKNEFIRETIMRSPLSEAARPYRARALARRAGAVEGGHPSPPLLTAAPICVSRLTSGADPPICVSRFNRSG